jgi:hypothetical protein
MYYRNMKGPGSFGTIPFFEPWFLEEGNAFRHDKG